LNVSYQPLKEGRQAGRQYWSSCSCSCRRDP
jgi:hypothetical protein